MSDILTACHISSPTGLLNSILGLSTPLEDEVCCRWLQYLPIKKKGSFQADPSIH